MTRADWAGVFTGTALAIFIVPVIAVTAAPELSDAERCGGGANGNSVREQFTLASAKDLWREFPAMRQAPGIERDARPARVVVFDDGYDLGRVALGKPQDAGPVDTVVCVISDDGEISLFTSVSRQGSRLAP